jgi:hypothetical protein
MSKSKEDVYNIATLKNLGNNPQGTKMDVVYSAMDEYAKQQSIEFKAWCEELNKIRSGLLIGNPYNDLKTDDQKYDQFIKDKTINL